MGLISRVSSRTYRPKYIYFFKRDQNMTTWPIYTSIAIVATLFFVILWLLTVKSPSKFTPKNIVIIGGSSGLGLELAKIYSKKYPNANLFLLSRKNFQITRSKKSAN